jgi:hypothetical protein
MLLVLGALTALTLAVLLAPAPEPGLGGAAALGRSLGGLRVVAVDALFFRAEALRRRGDVEDLPALYNGVLELDPENEPAFDHLAAVYAYDVLPEAREPDDRFGWWTEAWNAVAKGFRAHPNSERLHWRAFDLLTLAASDRDLEPRARAHFDEDPELLGFRHLRKALIAGEGRVQLWYAAFDVPLVAAQRLGGGRGGVEEILEVGRVALDLRREVLDVMSLPYDEPPEARGPKRLSDFLERSLAAVEEVRRALAAGDREAARAAADAYAAGSPKSPTAGPLVRAAER